MAARLPLPTLLSQVLVAFTIELDNEFERRMPHRTSLDLPGESRDGPWLASLVMWSNVLRLVHEEGVRVRDIQDAGGNLAGMERWRYVVVEPDPVDVRAKPSRLDWLVRPTAKGRRADEVWRPLLEVIERRWEERFGADEIAGLRTSLGVLAGRLTVHLPEYLPVLGYGLWSRVPGYTPSDLAVHVGGALSDPSLAALLSKVLLSFAAEFESQSDVSLAIGANVLRILDESGVRVRDLPRLSGVSKEAISMATGFLDKRGYLAIEPDPTGGRDKLARLTPEGRKARDAYRRLLDEVEEEWVGRFGNDAVRNLRESLEPLVGDPTAGRSPLFQGLEPYADGWRASVRKPETLPHYPMVLHRGGYPDGS